jgi:hypothetical protein
MNVNPCTNLLLSRIGSALPKDTPLSGITDQPHVVKGDTTVETKAPPHFLNQILNTTVAEEKIEHDIDVVSEDADTPTFASLHDQFADMNVVQPDTTEPRVPSPHYTHPNISSLMNNSEDEEKAQKVEEEEAADVEEDIDPEDVDADIDGDSTGNAEPLVRLFGMHFGWFLLNILTAH